MNHNNKVYTAGGSILAFLVVGAILLSGGIITQEFPFLIHSVNVADNPNWHEMEDNKLFHNLSVNVVLGFKKDFNISNYTSDIVSIYFSYDLNDSKRLDMTILNDTIPEELIKDDWQFVGNDYKIRLDANKLKANYSHYSNQMWRIEANILNSTKFLIGFGTNSTIYSYDMNSGLVDNNVRDVFIYDITQDNVDYTTWYNDSSLSWWFEANDTIVDNSLLLDGASDFRIPYSERYEHQNMTVMFWFNRESFLENYDGIIGNLDGDNNGWSIYMHQVITGGGLSWIAGDEEGTDCYAITNFVPNNSVWYHVALVMNDTKAVLYIDGLNAEDTYGVYSGSNNCTGDLNTSYNVVVGRNYPNDPQYYFDGRVDELRILNRTLSLGEIEDDIDRGRNHLLNNITDGLQGYWEFENAEDSSSFNNVGSIFTGNAQISGRSSKKEFPLLSYIIASDGGVDIIDAETDKLWMRTLSGTGCSGGSCNSAWLGDSCTLKSVAALNGKIYVGPGEGSYTAGGGCPYNGYEPSVNNNGMGIMDFVDDRGYIYLEYRGWVGNNYGDFRDRNCGYPACYPLSYSGNCVNPIKIPVNDLDIRNIGGTDYLLVSQAAGEQYYPYQECPANGGLNIMDVTNLFSPIYYTALDNLTPSMAGFFIDDSTILYATGSNISRLDSIPTANFSPDYTVKFPGILSLEYNNGFIYAGTWDGLFQLDYSTFATLRHDAVYFSNVSKAPVLWNKLENMSIIVEDFIMEDKDVIFDHVDDPDNWESVDLTYDKNFATLGYYNLYDAIDNLYLNYSWNSNFTTYNSIKLERKFGCFQDVSYYYRGSCYDYDASDWIIFDEPYESTESCPTPIDVIGNATVPVDCISEDNPIAFKIETYGPTKFYETKLWANYSNIFVGIVSEIGPDFENHSNSAFFPEGVFGKGLYQTGTTDYFNTTLANPDGTIGLENATVEFWAKLDYDIGNGGLQEVPYLSLFDWYDYPCSGYYGFESYTTSAGLTLGWGTGPWYDWFVLTGFDIPKQTWHHYAFTWSINDIGNTTDNVRYYIDGVMVGKRDSNLSQMMECNWTDIQLQTENHGSGTNSNNVMDNFKIYDYVKTNFSDAYYEAGNGTVYTTLAGDSNVINTLIGEGDNTVIWAGTTNLWPLTYTDIGYGNLMKIDTSTDSLITNYTPENKAVRIKSSLDSGTTSAWVEGTTNMFNSNQMTISTWWKPSKDAGFGGVVSVFSKTNFSNDNGFDFGSISSGTNLFLEFIQGTGAYQACSIPTPYLANRWTYVSVTFDDITDNCDFYENGIYIGTSQLTSYDISQVDNAEPFQFGDYRYVGTHYGDGINQIDEFRAYNRSLTADEIRELYLTSLNHTESIIDNKNDLIAYYQFNGNLTNLGNGGGEGTWFNQEPSYVSSNYGTPTNNLVGYNFNALNFYKELITEIERLIFGTDTGAGIIAEEPEGTLDTNVTYGAGITSLVFKPKSIYQQDVSPVGQTNIIPIYVVCNNGTGKGDFLDVKIQDPLTTGWSVKCDDDNTPAGATVLTTNYQIIYSGVIPSETCKNVWCWADLLRPRQDTKMKIKFNITR